jgi:hypothetical protein
MFYVLAYLGLVTQFGPTLDNPHHLSPPLCIAPLHLVNRWHSTSSSRQREPVCCLVFSSFVSMLIAFLVLHLVRGYPGSSKTAY